MVLAMLCAARDDRSGGLFDSGSLGCIEIDCQSQVCMYVRSYTHDYQNFSVYFFK